MASKNCILASFRCHFGGDCTEYLAHYDEEKGIKQTLQEHLSSVAVLAREHVPPNVKFALITSEMLKEMIFWMGYFHDLGKYTDYFQNYMINKVNSNYKNHAHISACFMYSFFLGRMLDLPDNDQKRITAFLLYLCVRLHHGALTMEGLFSIARENEMWKTLQVTEKNLVGKSKNILEDIGLGSDISKTEFMACFRVDELKKEKRNFQLMPQLLSSGRIKDDHWFFFIVYMFSLLIDSDKLDSAGIKSEVVRSVLPEAVVKYIGRKYSGGEKSVSEQNVVMQNCSCQQLKNDDCHQSGQDLSLINRREKARLAMIGVIDGLTSEEIKKNRVFTLTAPTGIGKTLSSLQCALRLQERIQEVESYTPRIVAAIPFINIIEQNKKEYENVFENNLRLVVHHRLGDFSMKTSSLEEVPIDKALLEVESWEGDVVLTTFVQFFQSIFSGKNKLLKKINKLAGSIVILDEAQAIPERYMPIIGAVLQKMGEYWGTRFVLMTATQPKILEFGNLLLNTESVVNERKVVLLPNHEEYFANLRRTKFVPMLEKRLDTPEFLALFQEKWDGVSSALIVVNTIKRSIEIYNLINKRLKESGCSVPVYYLSTNIMPIKRREVIETVKDILTDKKPVILVSTQTIEAGVDLDFNMAFRDFAPLDSLIQTAGRVNREGKKGDYLPVYIVQLESDNHYVYGLTHRQATMGLFKKYEEIEEPQYGSLADKYYTMALERGISDDSKRLWNEGILKLNFEILQEFQLIENSQEVVDVFVEDGSKEASLLADAYEELLRYKDYFNTDLSEIFTHSVITSINGKISSFERKALLRLVLAKMSDYIIQVRIGNLKKNRPVDFKERGDVKSSLYWIPTGQLEHYYNKNTGFISELGDAFIL